MQQGGSLVKRRTKTLMEVKFVPEDWMGPQLKVRTSSKPSFLLRGYLYATSYGRYGEIQAALMGSLKGLDLNSGREDRYFTKAERAFLEKCSNALGRTQLSYKGTRIVLAFRLENGESFCETAIELILAFERLLGIEPRFKITELSQETEVYLDRSWIPYAQYLEQKFVKLLAT